MTTMIAGHALTRAQIETLDRVLDYLRKHSGDSGWAPGASPTGDGREVSVYEIFPVGGNAASARRRTLSRLITLGVLRACEVVWVGGRLKGVPLGSGVRAEGATRPAGAPEGPTR